MTFDEALSAAILGDKVRPVDMQPGAFIDYQFNGWRINMPSGSSSGYTLKEHDKTVAWELYVKPEPVFVPSPFVNPEPAIAAAKRGRKAWVPPSEVNDIGWHGNPNEVVIKSNPWAEAGLTAEPKPASGWAIFNKDK
jgi:hypothetical protein